MRIIPSAIAAAFMLAILLPAVPAAHENDSGAPAGCRATTYINHWAYQQIPGVKQRWDDWSAQSRGVCVMDPSNVSAPGQSGAHEARACVFVASKPMYTAGGVPSGDLCWWGLSTRPDVKVSTPTACTQTDMKVRVVYQQNAEVRRLWDSYLSQTLGTCESFAAQPPADCKFAVSEGQGPGGTKWLCWWPSAPVAGVVQSFVGPEAYLEIIRSLLSIDSIKEFLGEGKTMIEIKTDSITFRVVVEGGVLGKSSLITPPPGCAKATWKNLGPYLTDPATRARWDEWASQTRDVCTMGRAPSLAECKQSERLGPWGYICFWGEPKGASALAPIGGPRLRLLTIDDEPHYTVRATDDAARAVINSGDYSNKLKELLAGGFITLSASDFSKQAQIKAALRFASGSALPFEPFAGEGSQLEWGGNSGPVTRLGRGYIATLPTGPVILDGQGSAEGTLSPGGEGALMTLNRIDRDFGGQLSGFRFLPQAPKVDSYADLDPGAGPPPGVLYTHQVSLRTDLKLDDLQLDAKYGETKDADVLQHYLHGGDLPSDDPYSIGDALGRLGSYWLTDNGVIGDAPPHLALSDEEVR